MDRYRNISFQKPNRNDLRNGIGNYGGNGSNSFRPIQIIFEYGCYQLGIMSDRKQIWIIFVGNEYGFGSVLSIEYEFGFGYPEILFEAAYALSCKDHNFLVRSPN